MTVSEHVVGQFVELLQRFVRLRMELMLPEHLVRFKRRMESSRGNSGSPDDYTFLFRIFTILAQSGTPPTMGELSSDLAVPLSTATRIVDWLVRANFVERVDDSHDRRVVRVRMTASGEELYQISMEYNKQQIARLLSNFTPDEQVQMLRLITRLVDVLVAEK